MKKRPVITLHIDNSSFTVNCTDIEQYKDFKKYFKKRVNKTELCIIDYPETLEDLK